jgi:hypothetical protein
LRAMGTETWFIFLRRSDGTRLLGASDWLTPQLADALRDAVAATLTEDPTLFDSVDRSRTAKVEVRSSSELRNEPATLIKLAREWRPLEIFAANLKEKASGPFWAEQRHDFYQHWSDVFGVSTESVQAKARLLRSIEECFFAARTYFPEPSDDNAIPVEPELVAVKEIAARIRVSRSTADRLKAEWGEPDERGQGSRPDRWSFERIKPILLSQLDGQTQRQGLIG